MTGVIKKIHPLRHGPSGQIFQRVEFEIEREPPKWAKTDLCPGYRNYPRWIPLLHVGIKLSNLNVDGKTVDADSFPVLVSVEPPQAAGPDPQMDLI